MIGPPLVRPCVLVEYEGTRAGARAKISAVVQSCSSRERRCEGLVRHSYEPDPNLSAKWRMHSDGLQRGTLPIERPMLRRVDIGGIELSNVRQQGLGKIAALDFIVG